MESIATEGEDLDPVEADLSSAADEENVDEEQPEVIIMVVCSII